MMNEIRDVVAVLIACGAVCFAAGIAVGVFFWRKGK
jgi:hypothetical protein